MFRGAFLHSSKQHHSWYDRSTSESMSPRAMPDMSFMRATNMLDMFGLAFKARLHIVCLSACSRAPPASIVTLHDAVHNGTWDLQLA